MRHSTSHFVQVYSRHITLRNNNKQVKRCNRNKVTLKRVYVLGTKKNTRKFNTTDVETNIDFMHWVRNFFNIDWLPSWILEGLVHFAP